MKPSRVYTLGILPYIRRNPPKHPPSFFELRPSPTVVGYGRRRSEGPTVAFIHGLTPMVCCEGGQNGERNLTTIFD